MLIQGKKLTMSPFMKRDPLHLTKGEGWGGGDDGGHISAGSEVFGGH